MDLQLISFDYDGVIWLLTYLGMYDMNVRACEYS